MRWTEDRLAAHLARTGVPGAPNRADTSSPPFKLPGNEAGRYALGRLPTGAMNKTEAKYAAHLDALKHAGEILWFKFEGIKLRLARLEARLAAGDTDFHRPSIDALGLAMRGAR